MKILCLSTSTNNTDTCLDSLRYLGEHEIQVFRYDRKWAEQCQLAIQSNPEVKNLLQMGAWPPPEHRAAWRTRVETDGEMIALATEKKPDCILYISAWEGLFVPTHETLATLNSIAPLVHLCFDGSDPPWHSQLKEFEEKNLFSLTVNIDGGKAWPGGDKWDSDWKIKNALTTLTPIDPRYFEGVQVPYLERPYQVAYAGNAGGWIRNHLVSQFQKHKTDIFTYRPRDDFMGSYGHYCTFLRHCKVVISVPFTGSNATKHVKGRVLEAGWAGACLLEWKNYATREWLEPRRDYWEYENIEDCMEMADFLARHPRLTHEMAQSLNRRITTEHSPQVIWGKIFDALIACRP